MIIWAMWIKKSKNTLRFQGDNIKLKIIEGFPSKNIGVGEFWSTKNGVGEFSSIKMGVDEFSSSAWEGTESPSVESLKCWGRARALSNRMSDKFRFGSLEVENFPKSNSSSSEMKGEEDWVVVSNEMSELIWKVSWLVVVISEGSSSVVFNFSSVSSYALNKLWLTFNYWIVMRG